MPSKFDTEEFGFFNKIIPSFNTEILSIKTDNETLRKISKPVEKFDSKLHELLDDMAETMYKAEGAGLAGVQVGVLRRVFVIDTGKRKLEFVNPEIIKVSGENKIVNEGCLSVPNDYMPREDYKVLRPNVVHAKYFDRFGKEQTIRLVGYEAKAFCHEYDHLNGIVFVDWAKKQKGGKVINTDPKNPISLTVL